MTETGWIILGLVLCSGGTLLCTAATISLRTFSHMRLHEAFKGAGPEKMAERLVKHAEQLALTCSSYRLILNVTILVLFMHLFVQPDEAGSKVYGYVLTVAVGAIVLLVLALAVPNALAKYAGEKLLRRMYWVLRAGEFVAWPLLQAWSLIDAVVRRMAGVADSTPEEQQEERQEEFLTDLAHQRLEGVVDEEEQEMIENVLELSETTADEIMTPRTDIVALEVNSNLKTIIDTITEAGHTRLPVYEENIDRIIGLVYAKDLLPDIGKDPSEFQLRGHMRDVYFVPESKPLRILLKEFQTQKLHIAVVLDEYGGTAGVVTLEDILEELVGEIADEYEQAEEEAGIVTIDENTFEVDARTYVDDLNDEFELDLPEDEDYDTVGGFVFSQLGYIPKSGEHFAYQNLKFEILSAEARKIGRLRIQRTVEPS